MIKQHWHVFLLGLILGFLLGLLLPSPSGLPEPAPEPAVTVDELEEVVSEPEAEEIEE